MFSLGRGSAGIGFFFGGGEILKKLGEVKGSECSLAFA